MLGSWWLSTFASNVAESRTTVGTRAVLGDGEWGSSHSLSFQRRPTTTTATVPSNVGRSEDPRRTLELILRWQQQGDERACEQLCLQYMPLARGLALRYRNPHEPVEDLVQVASVGLLGAINRFCPDRGASFAAFAIPTILGELKRHFRNTGWAAHVPRGAQELTLRVDRAARQLADSGRSPTVQAIAEHLEVSPDDALAGLQSRDAHYSVSLDAPAPGAESEEPQPLTETLGRLDDEFELVDTRLWLQSAVRRLPYRERQALTLRLENGLKQTEIAREMSCSQMQISRLLRHAVAHLRELAEPRARAT